MSWKSKAISGWVCKICNKLIANTIYSHSDGFCSYRANTRMSVRILLLNESLTMLTPNWIQRYQSMAQLDPHFPPWTQRAVVRSCMINFQPTLPPAQRKKWQPSLPSHRRELLLWKVWGDLDSEFPIADTRYSEKQSPAPTSFIAHLLASPWPFGLSGPLGCAAGDSPISPMWKFSTVRALTPSGKNS